MLSRFRAACRALTTPQLTRADGVWDAETGRRLPAVPSTNWGSVSSPSIVRDRARDLDRNSAYSHRIVEMLSVDATGGGIVPVIRHQDPAIPRAFKKAWRESEGMLDFNGLTDFAGMLRAVAADVVRDGEHVSRIIPTMDRRIPMQIQRLAPEHLDGSLRTDRIRDGIQFDSQGRREGFWIFERHPADVAPIVKSHFHPAAQVLHAYRQSQPGVQRGTSWLAPAMLALTELREYLEASLVRQKTAALYCGYVRTNDGSTPLNQGTDNTVTFEPGTMARLKPGEEVEFSDPPDVEAMFDPFVRAQLRTIAAAVGVPYELLSGDLSGVTFASGRHAILAYRRQIAAFQDHILIHQFCRPVLEVWVRLAIAAGVLPGSPEDYSTVRWIAPKIESLDAKSEVQASLQMQRAGYSSRSEIVASYGWDAEDVDEEIAADNRRADRLGLVLDSDPRKTTLQGQEQIGASGAE